MRQFDGFMSGINLGGWLSQCEITDEHMNTFITESDIEKIAGLSVDHVRLPIDYAVFENEDGSEKDNGYVHIDDCVSWCKKYGLNLVLDLHKTAGYIFDDSDNCKGFFYDEALKKRFLNIWDRLSKRYSSSSDMIAFELLNEVVDPEVKDIWNELAEQAVKVIRQNAPNTWILIGGHHNNSVTAIKDLKKPYDDKIVFNFHCYEPLIFTHQAAYWVDGMTDDFKISYPKDLGEYEKVTKSQIGEFFSRLIEGYDGVMCDHEFFKRYFEEAIEIAKKYDVPLYCGEYGVIDRADTEGTLNWYRDINRAFKESGIARCAWSYKKMDFGITDTHYAPVFEELVKYL